MVFGAVKAVLTKYFHIHYEERESVPMYGLPLILLTLFARSIPAL